MSQPIITSQPALLVPPLVGLCIKEAVFLPLVLAFGVGAMVDLLANTTCLAHHRLKQNMFFADMPFQIAITISIVQS